MTDLQAFIGGLIVDPSDRRCGIGRRLMQYAEQWAVTQGCTSVLLRSNIVREDAHSCLGKYWGRRSHTPIFPLLQKNRL